MAWPESKIATGERWWDWTCLNEPNLFEDAAKLTAEDLKDLSREGFEVTIYDTREEFFLAEAMEYVNAWRESTPDNPVGIVGPIGPTQQLPVVAQIINSLELDVSNGYFWGMDEWVGEDGKMIPLTDPMSFELIDRELCFDRIDRRWRMPDQNLYFPSLDSTYYVEALRDIRIKTIQGGQGDTKHWAFNEPPKREGLYADRPPTIEEYLTLGTRLVDLHPQTLIQNARTSAGGQIQNIPTRAVTIGPVETWWAEEVSIWHTGWHDNAFGTRLTTLMIFEGIADPVVPMSLLSRYPGLVKFNFLRDGIGEVKRDPN